MQNQFYTAFNISVVLRLSSQTFNLFTTEKHFFILHLISINIIGKRYKKPDFLLLKPFQTIKFTKDNPMILIISF